MAFTEAGRRLTEKHMQQQEQLAEQLIHLMIELFMATVTWWDIDSSSKNFVAKATPKILQYRELSRIFSQEYLKVFRAVEYPKDPVPSDTGSDNIGDGEVVSQMLLSSGAVLKKLSQKGYSEDDAMRRAATTAALKAAKIVADGGRKVLEKEVKAGRGAVGYARVVDADPCAFCAMLASRGVSYTGLMGEGEGLYRSDSFKASNARFQGKGNFKVHDGCSCTLEPVYKVKGKLKLPGNADRLAREWAAIAAGRGPDSFNTWRRWRDNSTLPEDYDGDLEGVKRPTPARGRAKGVRKASPGKKRGGKRMTIAQQKEFIQRRINRIDEEIARIRSEAGSNAETISKQDIDRLEEVKKRLLSRIENLG